MCIMCYSATIFPHLVVGGCVLLSGPITPIPLVLHGQINGACAVSVDESTKFLCVQNT